MGPHLHYDHNATRDGYLGFAHAHCNRSAGAIVGAQRAMGKRPMPSLFDWATASLSFQPEAGVPHVGDLPHDLISQFNQPYMERYYLLGGSNRAPGTTARYHHILASDVADLHDHPWDFLSVIISGRYIETTPTTEQEYGPGSVLVRKAEQLHRLTLPDGPVWTFVVIGPARRRWGFKTTNGWMHWTDYLGIDVAPPVVARGQSRAWNGALPPTTGHI